MSKERGILFSAPMVRAILEGRKTQTRRVVQFPPYDPCDEGLEIQVALENCKCPYGKPGDRLWVRETFKAVMGMKGLENGGTAYDPWRVYYRATPDLVAFHEHYEYARVSGPEPIYDDVLARMDHEDERWRSPLFMPRWASRITLEITDVRVERVQEISSADALAEGIRRATMAEQEAAGTFLPRVDTGWFTYDGGGLHNTTAGAYAELWDSINGKTIPWASNPWVWALTFKRVQ